MLAIDARDVEKTFRSGWLRRRETHALRGVSLAVERGSIFGLLGPNGAGKTTLLSILATLLTPDRGQVLVLGHDVVREASVLRRRLNMASGRPSFLWSLRVDEIISFYGRLYGLSGQALRRRVDGLIEQYELTPYRRAQYNELSTGIKQRVALAKALVNDPELLFLDEPTLGLDPDVSVRVRQHIAALRRERGMTIVLTTHYMREAEELCELQPYRRVPYSDLSTGLKQRVALAKSLVNDPELLFLDEPTLGLDPDVSVRVREHIAKLRREQGITIVLTTHYMREADELCDEIAFIKAGRILSRGTPGELKRRIRLGEVIALRLDPRRVTWLAEAPGVLRCVEVDGWVECTVDEAEKRLPELLRALHNDGVVIRNVQVREPELEEVFVELAK